MGVPPFGTTKTINVSASRDGREFTQVGAYQFSPGKEERHTFILAPVSIRSVRLTYADRYDQDVGYPRFFSFTTELEVYAPEKKGAGSK